MRVAIAGGGTGGHLFPGIALAQELTKRGHEVFFIGNTGRIEEKKVPQYGFEIEFVKGGQVKGAGFVGAMRGLAATLQGLVQAWIILGRRKPIAVIGVGGYASVAGVTAAWLRRVMAVVCEQNAVPGRANRFLARIANVVFVAFPEAVRRLHGRRVQISGNPLRLEFREQFDQRRAGKKKETPCLFVLGGSQGARTLNHAAVEAVKLWIKSGGMPWIVHQTGPLHFEEVKAKYDELEAEVEVMPFIDDMPAAYAKADLVLARAGAMSITEIAACGLPSVLVPFPYAADDHQRHNAQALADAGGAIIVNNDELSGQTFVSQVDGLLGDPAKLEVMGKAAKSFDRPHAARAICDEIERMAKER